MQLVSYRSSGTADIRWGVLTASGVAEMTGREAGLPTDVIGVLAGGEALRERIRALAGGTPRDELIAPEQVELLAPIPRPGKIIAIGLNYRDHAEETGDAIPEVPVVFAKFPTAVTGPYADVVYPELSARLDYEGELGVVIGRRCAHLTTAEAPGVVGGYVVLNDVSARDVQNQTSQWILGKSFDTFAPFGPALVTPDEVGDPQNLDISLQVNDDVRQQSNTKNMIFGVYDLISRLSRVCTLEPGDVIATGTPGGVGIGFSPERLLSVGDQVTVTIERIGRISNRIVAPAVTR